MPKRRSRKIKAVKNSLIYYSLRIALGMVRLLPRKASLVLVTPLAALGFVLAVAERKRLLENLEQTFGSQYPPARRNQIGRQVFRNIAGNLVDAVLTDRLLRRAPEAIIQIEGLSHARQALEQGRGVIFLTAHTGCFEMLPARFSQLGFPMIVAGAPIYDPRLNRLVAKSRTRFNVEYVERNGDLRTIVRGLKKGKAFGVLCDLDTRVDSLFIPFFGRPAKTPVVPFRLGVRHRVPLVPVFASRRNDGTQKVVIYPALQSTVPDKEGQIREMMTHYNRMLEDLIRRDPAQWIWMHKRWKSRPC